MRRGGNRSVKGLVRTEARHAENDETAGKKRTAQCHLEEEEDSPACLLDKI